MAQHLVRLLFLLVVLSLTTFHAFQTDVMEKGARYVTLYIVVPAVAALGLVLVDIFWRRKPLHVIAGLFVGALGGMGIGIVLALVVRLVAQIFFATTGQAGDPGPVTPVEEMPIVRLLQVLVGSASTFLGVTFVLQTKDNFRFVLPYIEFSRESKGARPLLLDTSVIIDGRIADIAETRMLESEVLVPRFILDELQTVADSGDKLKRNRGRRGLDILDRLQKSDKVDLDIFDANVPDVEKLADVDAQLVALADHLSGRVVTNDYNLNKIAKLRGVDVININDLANALKPVFLPGEMLTVKIVKPGEDAGQGVGYLDDGTMVVTEQARDYVGREVTLVVTSVLQTSAGRMIFGRLDADRTFSRHQNGRRPAPEKPTE